MHREPIAAADSGAEQGDDREMITYSRFMDVPPWVPREQEGELRPGARHLK